MAAVISILQRGLLYLLLVQLGAVSLLWNLFAWLAYPLIPKRAGTLLGRAVISRVYRLFWATTELFGMLQVDAAALELLADEPGGLIIAANHPTMLDALVLVAYLRRGVCIMKADLMRNPFLAAGARLARYIRNDSPRGMMRCAVECLQEGGQLVMFPEGTRTVHRPVNPLPPRHHLDRAEGARADPDRDHRDRHAVPAQGLADLARPGVSGPPADPARRALRAGRRPRGAARGPRRLLRARAGAGAPGACRRMSHSPAAPNGARTAVRSTKA